jgi:hypothetical protein
MVKLVLQYLLVNGCEICQWKIRFGGGHSVLMVGEGLLGGYVGGGLLRGGEGKGNGYGVEL